MGHGIVGYLLPKEMEMIRKEKKATRLNMTEHMVDERSSVISKNLLSLNILDQGFNIATFASFQNEPNTEELTNHFWADRKEVYLPVTNEGSLKFYNYNSESYSVLIFEAISALPVMASFAIFKAAMTAILFTPNAVP